MNLDKTAGQIIMSLCQEAGISRSELARRLGVTPSQISRIVNEETKTISSEILIAMTKEFGVSADYILGLTDKKAGNNSVDNPVIFHGTMKKNSTEDFNINNICRITVSITCYMHWFKVSIITTKLIFSYSFIIWFSLCHLRMICWLFFIKNANIFMFS